MAASKAQISAWFDDGLRLGATHLLIVCDLDSWEDSPKFVRKGQSVRRIVVELNRKDGQQVIEIYHLAMSKEKQLAERRAWHFEHSHTYEN